MNSKYTKEFCDALVKEICITNEPFTYFDKKYDIPISTSRYLFSVNATDEQKAARKKLTGINKDKNISNRAEIIEDITNTPQMYAWFDKKYGLCSDTSKYLFNKYATPEQKEKRKKLVKEHGLKNSGRYNAYSRNSYSKKEIVSESLEVYLPTVKEAFELGFSIAEIADLCDISARSVHKLLHVRLTNNEYLSSLEKRFSVLKGKRTVFNRERNRSKNEQEFLAKELRIAHKAGLSIDDLANEHVISKQYVHSLINGNAMTYEQQKHYKTLKTEKEKAEFRALVRKQNTDEEIENEISEKAGQ